MRTGDGPKRGTRCSFAKLGRGQASGGCLECPWHRARYDVRTAEMREGPKRRMFGLPPHSAIVKAAANTAFTLRTFPVVVRAGTIELVWEPCSHQCR